MKLCRLVMPRIQRWTCIARTSAPCPADMLWCANYHAVALVLARPPKRHDRCVGCGERGCWGGHARMWLSGGEQARLAAQAGRTRPWSVHWGTHLQHRCRPPVRTLCASCGARCTRGARTAAAGAPRGSGWAAAGQWLPCTGTAPLPPYRTVAVRWPEVAEGETWILVP